MESSAEAKDETQELGQSGKLMKLKVFQDPENDALQKVIAMITPLPRNITPSERFLHQMRQRLLQLQAPPARRAA
jgi:hypothetical protein